jgi:hypothetical protein
MLSTLAILLQGCYETLPLQQGPPPPVDTVQLLLNDKGRVAVGDKMGSGVAKVEGTVQQQSADSYTLAVTHVYMLNGTDATWNGELVTIAKDATDGYRIHRYNKSRTLALAGAITVAAVVFFVTVGLTGSGNGVSGSDQSSNGGQKSLVHRSGH